MLEQFKTVAKADGLDITSAFREAISSYVKTHGGDLAFETAPVFDDITLNETAPDGAEETASPPQNAAAPEAENTAPSGPFLPMITRDFADAETWEDLMSRLYAKGYWLYRAGLGLAVAELETCNRVGMAADFGSSYMGLVNRFGGHFPEYQN